jgi:hypothetical protein
VFFGCYLALRAQRFGPPAADFGETRLRKTTFSTGWPPRTAPTATSYPKGTERSEGEGRPAEAVLGGTYFLGLFSACSMSLTRW